MSLISLVSSDMLEIAIDTQSIEGCLMDRGGPALRKAAHGVLCMTFTNTDNRILVRCCRTTIY